MTTTHGIKLDEETGKRLKVLGALRGRSPHWLMRTAIEIYLEREENYERERREDMDAWEHYVLTGEAISHDKAAKWLNNLAQGKVKPCPK